MSVIDLCEQLDKAAKQSPKQDDEILSLLGSLKSSQMTLQLLQSTRVGVIVNQLKKELSPPVAALAKELVQHWKQIAISNGTAKASPNPASAAIPTTPTLIQTVSTSAESSQSSFALTSASTTPLHSSIITHSSSHHASAAEALRASSDRRKRKAKTVAEEESQPKSTKLTKESVCVTTSDALPSNNLSSSFSAPASDTNATSLYPLPTTLSARPQLERTYTVEEVKPMNSINGSSLNESTPVIAPVIHYYNPNLQLIEAPSTNSTSADATSRRRTLHRTPDIDIDIDISSEDGDEDDAVMSEEGSKSAAPVQLCSLTELCLDGLIRNIDLAFNLYILPPPLLLQVLSHANADKLRTVTLQCNKNGNMQDEINGMWKSIVIKKFGPDIEKEKTKWEESKKKKLKKPKEKTASTTNKSMALTSAHSSAIVPGVPTTASSSSSITSSAVLPSWMEFYDWKEEQRSAKLSALGSRLKAMTESQLASKAEQKSIKIIDVKTVNKLRLTENKLKKSPKTSIIQADDGSSVVISTPAAPSKLSLMRKSATLVSKRMWAEKGKPPKK